MSEENHRIWGADCCLCCRLVVDLLPGSRQLVTDLLRGNWCNRFWPI